MRLGIDMRAYSNAQYGGIAEYIRNVVWRMAQQERECEFKLFYSSRQKVEPLFLDGQFPHARNYFYRYPSKLFFLSTQVLKKPAVDSLLGGVDVFLVRIFYPLLFRRTRPKFWLSTMFLLNDFPHFFDAKRKAWHKAMHIKSSYELLITS